MPALLAFSISSPASSQAADCKQALALLWQIGLFREPVRIPESIFQ
jgi:hypothetical protein